jgi:hypothetical protein
MQLSHLGLPVVDAGRSVEFYADGVSFKCADPDGHRIEVYWEA